MLGGQRWGAFTALSTPRREGRKGSSHWSLLPQATRQREENESQVGRRKLGVEISDRKQKSYREKSVNPRAGSPRRGAKPLHPDGWTEKDTNSQHQDGIAPEPADAERAESGRVLSRHQLLGSVPGPPLNKQTSKSNYLP